MACPSEILSDNLYSNNSFKSNIPSTLLSPIKADTNIGLILTRQTTAFSRSQSLIYKHTYTTIAEEKKRTKKNYFYKYCPPKDLKGHHALTQGL